MLLACENVETFRIFLSYICVTIEFLHLSGWASKLVVEKKVSSPVLQNAFSQFGVVSTG